MDFGYILVVVMIGTFIVLVVVLSAIKYILLKIEHSRVYSPSKESMELCDIREIYSTVKEYNIVSDDGKANLYVLHIQKPESNKATIFAYGSGGSVAGRVKSDIIKILFEHGSSSIVLFDYRGYGKSSGTPSENGLYNDAYSVWNFITTDLGYSHINLYGFSLGTAVATHLGKRLCDIGEKPDNIVLQAGFTSFADIVGVMSMLMVNVYDSYSNLQHINTNVLCIHSHQDELVDYSHSVKLRSANHNVSFLEISGTHNDPVYDEHFIEYIKKHL